MMTATESPGAESPARRLDEPFITFDLPFEIARLRSEPAFEAEGHAGRTFAKFPDLRVVLEAMKEGISLPFHETEERMTVHVVLGQVRIWGRSGESCDVAEGSVAAIDTARVKAIECLRAGAFLLTLAWPPARRPGDGEGADTGGDGI